MPETLAAAAPARPSASAPEIASAPAPAPAPLSETLLRQLDTPGPRYTSYPTADRFAPRFGPADAARALRASASAGTAGAAHGALSLYVHIPFCEALCYYCACNKIITRHHERAAEYLDALEAELALVMNALGSGRALSQLHFGGGSPTFLSDAELARLMATLQASFRLTHDAEVSIEVDPRTVTPARLAHLKALGFTRLSFGVQDFDADVQQAVHRVQSFAMVQELMSSARALGFVSINTDLIYGLPKQTPASFERTLAQIGALRPDRIALYGYAHLPAHFKPQRRIQAADLPSAAQRVLMLGAAISALQARGYSHIGMDHFALHDDSLARAKREHSLQRNFQGYSTRPDCDLVALGVSAIGRVGGSYYQNAKTLPEYHTLLAAGRLPVVRGHALTPEDELRRELIMALMCQGRVDFAPLQRRHGVCVQQHFARELHTLHALQADGLLRLDAQRIELSASGWYAVRAVAMVFDQHLQQTRDRQRFSRVL